MCVRHGQDLSTGNSRMKMGRMSEGSGCGGGALGQLLAEVTVEPVLFLYMLSTFSQYALFQDLVYSKVCWAMYNESVCDNLTDEGLKAELTNVQTNSSHWILMSTITLVIPSLLIAIYLGSWSDRFGRKWPVVIPPLGGALSCLVYILISFKVEAPVAWILFASALSGFSGGFVSCIMSCMTYVASVSTEENRTVRISRLEAMTFLGGTIGPFVSGSMLQVTGHGYAFFFMMVSYTLAVLYAIFFVTDIHEGPDGLGSAARSQTRRNRLVVNDTEGPPSLLERSDKCPVVILAVPNMPEEGATARLDSVEKSLLSTTTPPGLANEPGSNNNNDCHPTTVSPSTVEKGKRMIMGNRRSRWSESGSDSSHSNSLNGIYCGGGGSGSHSDALSDDEHRNIINNSCHRQDTISDSPSSAHKTCCSRYFGSQHLLDVLATAFRYREDNRRLYLILVVLAAFLAMMVTAGELDVAYLFAKDVPLSWSYQTYSYYFGFKYGLGAFMLLVGMPIFLRLELADTTICLIGLLSRMAGLVLYGLSTTTYTAFCVPVVAAFSFFTIPATRALLSKIVAPSEQGKMFSFVAIMEDLCTLSASLVFNSVYPLTRHLYRGSIFFMAASLLLIPLILIWSVRKYLVLASLRMISSPSPTSMESGGTISESLESSKELQQQQKPEHVPQREVGGLHPNSAPELSPLIPSSTALSSSLPAHVTSERGEHRP